jgi:uncharacterized protein YkwD
MQGLLAVYAGRMKRHPFSFTLAVLLCVCLDAQGAARDPLIGLINAYRAAPGSCAGRRAAPLPPLAAPAALSKVKVGAGTMLDWALQRAGYRAAQAEAIYVAGTDDPVAAMGMIEQRYCATLLDPRFSAVGVVRAPGSWLIVLARPAPPPADTLLPPLAEAGRQLLAAVNRARAAERRCGTRLFAPAPALAWNDALAAAALAHSADMAAQRYLNHTGKDGRMAPERAAQAGYQGRRIGENIAAGQETAEEVVQGWLDSPGHCANIMHEDFTEMGAAYAVNRAREPARIYWTEVLGAPR